MDEENKPFLWIKARGGFRISPRNAQGWKWAFAWSLVPILLAGLLAWLLSFRPEDSVEALIIVCFVLVLIAWSVLMTRWMMARSVVVDVEELMTMKRNEERAGKRGRKL